MRERNAVKAARSVLRGGMGSNAYSLPDEGVKFSVSMTKNLL